jgi:hypothetical protein
MKAETKHKERPWVRIPDGEVSRQLKKDMKSSEIHVTEIELGYSIFYLHGTTPIVFNKMSGRGKRDLLLPPKKKTAADKAIQLKHDPIAEFRSSVHYMPPGSKTLLGFPAGGIKRAMASIAVDMPGSSKAQIGRLVRVTADDKLTNLVCVWGLPKLFMQIVRNSDIKHTPDVHTVAKIDEWLIRIQVWYPRVLLNPTSIFNLLHAAGMFIGLGDGRQEKGKLDNGSFEVFTQDGADKFKDILKIGYKEQEKAMEKAEPYSAEELELLTWYNEQLKIRGKEKPDGKAR